MLVRVRAHARHAKPSKAGPTIAAVGITASFVAVDIAVAGAASAATASDFAKLRQCESGDNYRINTGNGFYGAYQFDRGTWNGLGYPGRADQASPATQDEAARKLQSQRGWSPWPACSRGLGLSSDRTDDRASRSTTRTAAKPVSSPVARPSRAAVAPTTPPVFIGKPLSMADAKRFRIGVHMWQARMADRGWKISVDGHFGPQTAHIAKMFAADQKLARTGLSGEVDKTVWDAAWQLPVT
ncbi:MAG: transglycosylase family protein [Mycobacteriales bacterium]